MNIIINKCKEVFGSAFSEDEESVLRELDSKGKSLVCVNDSRLNNRKFSYKVREYIESYYPNIEFQELCFSYIK